jgi:hypothetical protein
MAFSKYENSICSTMSLLDISNIITSVEKGIFGLTFLLVPDYFWNPQDGVLSSLGFFPKTGLESNHIDVGSQIGLRLVGANLLALALGHFIMKEEADKRRFIRLKISMSLTILVLAFSKIFLNPPELLGKPFVGSLAAMSLLQILGLGTMLYGLKPIKTTIKKTEEERAPPAFVVLLGFLFLYTLFFVLMLCFKPDIFSPEGAMAFAVKIEEEGDAKYEIVEFTARLQGACLCAFLVPTMETIVDPTIHNVRKCCQLAAIVCALYTFGFMFGVFDTTGHSIKNVYILQTAVQVVVTGLLAKGAFLVGPAGKGDKGKVAAAKKSTEAPVPDLAVDENKIKHD